MVKKYFRPQTELVDFISENLMATSPIFPGGDDEEAGTKHQDFGEFSTWDDSDSGSDL
ncbi:MAG: hypothetical protein KBS75_01405 [Bacteroidales bacterium]|nr:hypothetical protein [Candidatus Equimonas faecalis]